MANIIKLNVSVSYTEEELNKTTRFIDGSIAHEPVSYETGEAQILGNTTDLELVTNVNMISILADKPCTIKIGDTTNIGLTNMRIFCYDGATTTIFVSNPGVDPVKLKFTSAKF